MTTDGNVICPDGQSECKTGQTCCKQASGQYGCCPLPKVGLHVIMLSPKDAEVYIKLVCGPLIKHQVYIVSFLFLQNWNE